MRVAAVVLPELACEVLALREPGREPPPLGVVIGAEEDDPSVEPPPLPGHASLDVVSRSARRFGVRAGQSVVEAAALVSSLVVRRVSTERVEGALGSLAEALSPCGRTLAIRLSEGASLAAARTPRERKLALSRARVLGPWDTVWLDVTGVAHLFGGEEALAEQLVLRAAALGHHARVALADGPLAAQAVARDLATAVRRLSVVPVGGTAAAVAALSVFSLPLERPVASWVVRLGVLTVRDLAAVARSEGRAALLTRLAADAGPDARASAALAVGLALGEDDLPLLAHAPARTVTESTSFDAGGSAGEHGVETTTGLLFVLSRLVSRAVGRLAARGEAASGVALRGRYDPGVARARAAELGRAEVPRELSLHVGMASPVSKKEEIFRSLELRLERTELFAPVVELALELSELAPAARWQLDLGRDGAADEARLPALLAELSSEIGADRVGTLEEVDEHRLERRSRLARVEKLAPKLLARERPRPERDATQDPRADLEASLGPTRLLAEPAPLGFVDWSRAQGGVVVVTLAEGVFRASRARFWLRQEGLEWWTDAAASRDYFRVWLEPDAPPGRPALEEPAGGSEGLRRRSGDAAGTEALVFVDRASGRSYLQGYWE